jgi:hypothetical protein
VDFVILNAVNSQEMQGFYVEYGQFAYEWAAAGSGTWPLALFSGERVVVNRQ